jgi:hypothetical protein
LSYRDPAVLRRVTAFVRIEDLAGLTAYSFLRAVALDRRYVSSGALLIDTGRFSGCLCSPKTIQPCFSDDPYAFYVPPEHDHVLVQLPSTDGSSGF